MTKLPEVKFPRLAKHIFWAVPIAALSLFINKAFHIDDALFLRMSEIVPWTLFGDHRGTIHFLGTVYRDLSVYESTHPILIPYFLKVAGLFQWGEEPVFWTYHLFFLVFPLGILIAYKQFAKVFALDKIGAWLLLFSPLFFVNATNLMTDIPMLCFWVGSLFSLLIYCRTARHVALYWSGLFFFLALMTSYQSLALLPLFLVILAIYSEFKRRTLLILTLPLAGFTVYLVTVYLISGYFPFLASSIDLNITTEVQSGLAFSQYLHKAISVTINLGLGLGLATPLLIAALRPTALKRYLVLALILGFVLFHWGVTWENFEGYSYPELIWLRLMMTVGLFWCCFVVAALGRGFGFLGGDRDKAALWLTGVLWFLGVLFYNIFLMPYGIARYLLPAIPPALLLLTLLPRLPHHKTLRNICLAATLILSIFMTAIDYRQARADYLIYKEAKKDLETAGKIWYSDDAGLKRYLPLIDAAYLPADQKTIGITDKLLITRGLVDEDLRKSARLDKRIAIPSFWGFTLFDTENWAGFYRSLDGLLPMAMAPIAKRAYLFQPDFFKIYRDDVEAITLANPNYHDYRTFLLSEGIAKDVMFMHPDAKVAYPLNTGREMTLKGWAITDPSAWSSEGDGVTCSLGIYDETGERVLWQAYIDGKNTPNDRKGRAFKVKVPLDATRLWFAVGPGPKHDYRYDSMGWYGLVFEEVAPE